MRGVGLLVLLTGCGLYFGSSGSHGSDGGTRADGRWPDALVADATIVPPDAPPVLVCDAPPADGPQQAIVFDSDRANLNRDVYLIHPDGSGLQRLTTDTGIDREPTASPDGRIVVFSSNRGGTFQLYAMCLASLQVVQLTTMTKGAEEPSFSHDGKLIAFRSDTSIYTVHPDGTARTFVIDSGLSSFNSYFWPHFSADDRELMFDRNNEIDAVHLDGTGFRYVVSNYTQVMKSPSPSPDGISVAYDTGCPDHSIWLTPATTQTDPCGGRRLTPADGRTAQRAAWGPGGVIAFEHVDTSSGLSQIALISDTPGSVAQDIAPDPSSNRDPAWLPGP